MAFTRRTVLGALAVPILIGSARLPAVPAPLRWPR